MGEIFAYSIESGIVLIFLYLTYRLLLAGEKQYALNRGVLLGIYVAALLAPLCILWFRLTGETDIISHPVPEMSGNVVIGELGGGIIRETDHEWLRWILWLYAAGASLTLIYFVTGLIRLSVIVRKGEKLRMGDFTLVITGRHDLAPFSWRKYVVVGDGKDLAESGAILTHELEHIMRMHRADLIFAQLYTIFMWYNPVSWLMMDELKTVHEYEADEAVIRSGANIKEYQLLLIKKAVGGRLPSFANSLNHSKLHKRITMMYKSQSGKRGRIGGIALIPALAIGMAVVSIPAVASVLSLTSDATLLPNPDYKVNEKFVETETPGIKVISHSFASESESAEQRVGKAETPEAKREDLNESSPAETGIHLIAHINDSAQQAPEASTATEQGNSNKEVFVTVEKAAEYPGGFNAMVEYLAKNIRYPQEAMKENIQGRVIVRFIVTKTGEVKDAEVLNGIDKSLNDEAIRVVSGMPKWIPGKVNGKAVDSYFTLPVAFKLTDDGKAEEKK